MHSFAQPHRATVALAVVAIAMLAACSSSGGTTGDDNSPSTQPAAATQQPAATQPTQAESSKPPASAVTTSTDNVVSVDAIDSGSRMSYRISGTPSTGLATIRFSNRGHVAHEMGLSRLKDGATLDQLRKLLASQDPDAEKKAQALLIDPESELGGPSILGPGLSEQVMMPLAAGHYVVTCFLPGKNGVPHVAMGMIGEFSVEDSGSAAAAPQTTGTLTLTDSGISLPTGFSAGGTFEIANSGSKPHDVSIAKLAGKPLLAYFQCVTGSFGKGTPIDTCPGTLSGGVQTVQPGTSVYLTLPALPAGEYGYVSTEGEGADFQAGLNGTFTVK